VTTAETIDFLKTYWTAANGNETSLGRLIYADTADAQQAIDDLAYHAQGDADLRRAIAQAGLFELAISVESIGETDELMQQRAERDPACRGMLQAKSCDPRPPRLLMLTRVWEAGSGEALFQFVRVPVTEWLHSAQVAGTFMHTTITGDPNPSMRAIALKIVSDLAIPVEWLQEFKLQRTFETLADQLPRQQWSPVAGTDLSIRQNLQGLLAKAQGRVDAELAKTQLAQAGDLTQLTSKLSSMGFTAPTTGNGQAALTAPAPPVIWYKNPKLISAGVLGLVGGLLAAHGHRSQQRLKRR
jgi:hypothetical protein